MKFRDLKFGTKQMLGFGLILIIMAGVNLYSIQRMGSIKTEIDEVTNSWMPRAIAISELNLVTSQLRIHQLQRILAPGEKRQLEEQAAMVGLINKIGDTIDSYEAILDTAKNPDLYSAEEKKLYEDFDRKFETYKDLSIEYFMLLQQDKEQEAFDVLSKDAQTIFAGFSADLSKLVEVNRNDALAAAQRADDTFFSTRTITRVLLILTFILSGFMAFALVRLISTPLKSLVKAVKDVAGGDLDVNLDIDSKDEIGNLTTSFNQMTIALRDAREKERQEAKLIAEAAELRAKAKEAEAKALKAENDRKTAELEQARNMQLSMIPESLPDLADLDIAAYIKPATEVGGDYYDFKLEEDGTLTIAVGDATGHGLHAGMVVTASKSLFNALSHLTQPVKILQTASFALKQMGFRQMYMALTLAKIKNRKMTLSAAGMPYTLIYRAESKTVEEIVLKGMPLGSFPNFAYQHQELQLYPNDAVLFMSDGMPELFNDENEMLGEERTKYLFAAAAEKSSGKIIEHLLDGVTQWAGDRPPDDDMTFVAVKVK